MEIVCLDESKARIVDCNSTEARWQYEKAEAERIVKANARMAKAEAPAEEAPADVKAEAASEDKAEAKAEDKSAGGVAVTRARSGK